MPNHIQNYIFIEEVDDKEVETIINSVRGKGKNKSEFDFNTLIPMPKHSKRFCAKGGIGTVEKEKFGLNNWYDWSYTNWGTKWNAYECDLEQGEIIFQTAWNSPDPIIKKLSEKYPTALFKIYYADEDIGSNFGHYNLQAGKVVYEMIPPKSQKAKNEMAEKIWAGDLLDELGE